MDIDGMLIHKKLNNWHEKILNYERLVLSSLVAPKKV